MEISLEINPETLTACKIKSYLASGINKVFLWGFKLLMIRFLKSLGEVIKKKTYIKL